MSADAGAAGAPTEVATRFKREKNAVSFNETILNVSAFGEMREEAMQKVS